jgi:hypothetical protein
MSNEDFYDLQADGGDDQEFVIDQFPLDDGFDDYQSTFTRGPGPRTRVFVRAKGPDPETNPPQANDGQVQPDDGFGPRNGEDRPDWSLNRFKRMGPRQAGDPHDAYFDDVIESHYQTVTPEMIAARETASGLLNCCSELPLVRSSESQGDWWLHPTLRDCPYCPGCMVEKCMNDCRTHPRELSRMERDANTGTANAKEACRTRDHDILVGRKIKLHACMLMHAGVTDIYHVDEMMKEPSGDEEADHARMISAYRELGQSGHLFSRMLSELTNRLRRTMQATASMMFLLDDVAKERPINLTHGNTEKYFQCRANAYASTPGAPRSRADQDQVIINSVAKAVQQWPCGGMSHLQAGTAPCMASANRGTAEERSTAKALEEKEETRRSALTDAERVQELEAYAAREEAQAQLMAGQAEVREANRKDRHNAARKKSRAAGKALTTRSREITEGNKQAKKQAKEDATREAGVKHGRSEEPDEDADEA